MNGKMVCTNLKNNAFAPVITFWLLSLISSLAFADQTYSDDVIVKGSLCVGVDCNTGENFNFDTIRMRENNLRIRFIDSSSAGGFPTRDWQITANDSANGGLNKFSIENIDGETVPFTILDGADTNSLYIHTGGRIGLGTTAPQMQLHSVTGNSPTFRLEQDQSNGFSAQAWDVAANETNFFVRDVTSGGTLPLRIRVGAPNGALYVDSDGGIGFKTITPDGLFDIASPTDANNHAVLLSDVGNFGINIDNGFVPNALFEIQSTGGVSEFAVQSDGDVGIGTSTPSDRLVVMNRVADTTLMSLADSGELTLGTLRINSGNTFEIDNSSDQTQFSITNEGRTSFTGSYLDADATSCGGANGTFSIPCGRFTPLFLVEDTNASTGGRVSFLLKGNNPSWLGFENTSLDAMWILANGGDGSFGYTYYDKGTNEITVPFKIDNNGNVTASGTVTGSSSRALKENIFPVKPGLLLEKLKNLTISQWKYIADDDGVSHIGPMAEDFYELFSVGIDNKHISPADMAGIALASIQAVTLELEAKNQELDSLNKKYNSLLEKVMAIEERTKENP